MEFSSSLFAGEIPFNRSASAVETEAARANFAAPCTQVGDSSLPQAQAAEQAHLDLGLIEPTSVFGREGNREAVPEQAAQFLALSRDERFAAVRVQIVQNQMDGLSIRICSNDFHQIIGELRCRTRGRGFEKMPPRLRFHAARNFRSAAAFELVVASRHAVAPTGQRVAG